MQKHTELVVLATAAVELGKKILLTTSPSTVALKGDRDPVTSVDLLIEREIRAFMHSNTPDLTFLGEEEGTSGPNDSPYQWVLDPLDGTMNAISNVPLCGISLGLVRDDSPVLGVIELAHLGLTYVGCRGHGAYCNRQLIQPSKCGTLSDAIVAVGDFAVGINASDVNGERFRLIERLAEEVGRVRMFGSAAVDLAWVADGRLSASITLVHHPWDTAAGVAIARESGAEIIDRLGAQHTITSKSTIAVAKPLRDPIFGLIESI